MKGGVYSRQHCPICGSTYDHIENKGLICPNHPEKKATTHYVKYPGGIFKNIKNYEDAYDFLTGLRFKDREDSLDARDYKKDQPLGFSNLGEKYLKHLKKSNMRFYRGPRNHIRDKAGAYFSNQNIKTIGYAELEDFLEALPSHLSDKTKHNILGSLRAFWTWLRKRKVITAEQMPEFPEVEYELGYRKTVDKGTQLLILEKIKELTWHINPKIYIGCLFLSTYVNVRPIELIHIKEGDIDLHYGIMKVRYNKERKPKVVHLLSEDVELIKSFPTPISQDLYFFRHGKRKGVALKYRRRFGKHYLNDWWLKACKELGVEGVSPYPGTKHSTVIALGDIMTPEQIKKYGTGHTTNKAFDRYFQVDAEKKRELFAIARVATTLQPKKEGVEQDKVLELQK